MLLGEYWNGNYQVRLYDDGTKIRTAPDDDFIPAFAESCDITITEKCDGACSYCYAGCTPEGEYCDFTKYEELLSSIHPYTELAVNGNDLTHPNLVPFLKKMKDREVVVNMTVNQRHFGSHIDLIRNLCDEKLIRGLGVSLYLASQEFVDSLRGFPNAVVHVINGVFSPEDVEVLEGNDLKILILGYKQIGRGEDWFCKNGKTITGKQIWLNDNLPEIMQRFKIISFDNLALEQLDVRRLLTDQEWEEFYMGDDGVFTFFINLVQGYFAKDSLSPVHYEIGENDIDEMFRIIRQSEK